VLFVVLLGVFVATVSLCVGVYVFMHRRQFAAAELARARLNGELSDTAGRAPAASILRDTSASELEILDRLLTGKAVTARLDRALQRAGSTAKPGTFVLLLGIASVSGALVGSIVGSGLTIPLAAVGFAIPTLWLRQRQRRRLAAFQEQLPEAIDMLVSAMKAGYSFQAAMNFIGQEVPDPLGPEFARFYDEQRLGVDVRSALLNLQERVNTLDLKMFVTALLIQRETGGNLAEIMTNLSTLMRERLALRGQIDVLTAEPKMSAVVLTLIPIILFVIVNIINRKYMVTLYTEPTGRLLLVYAVVSTLVGYFVLQRIGKIDI
jgi:tight adherence protein B